MNRLEFEYRFNYRPLLLETGSRMALTPPLPVIEIEFSYQGATRTALSLIDSGSTFSIFSRVLADELGIEVVQGRAQRLTTLGGTLLAYAHEIGIEITPDLRYKTEVLFTEYPVPRNLLGHNGFLDRVAVALRSKYGFIYLNPES
ncbi:MAG: retroviral-like aspartic protease family protein [candidate division KSB1 bacterium]|nr:retroviral-like aspartic protease family protein [candidate division KSB1 bacterium]MDZ7302629.1 retroviral-like aspartic protease family protein [candidate division KSB1 bacterium]MDZ7311532.1 retroviral-like aspartic protease family protein [candidate division KSB1 bacterium]